MSSAPHNAAIRLSIPQISKVLYRILVYTLENTTNLIYPPSNLLQHVEFVKLLKICARYDKKMEIRATNSCLYEVGKHFRCFLVCFYVYSKGQIRSQISKVYLSSMCTQAILYALAENPQLGCPSKLVSIRNNRNWNRNQFRHYPKQNVCFGYFASIPKQRVSMFRLNRNKQKANRNSLIGSIFFTQFCEFKTREKVSCRTYVMLYCNTKNPRDKVN